MKLGTDILIVGGGIGGVSAALAALRGGRRVVLTEPTAWLGGQLTSQMVPTDEHLFIETTGRNQSYQEVRSALRDFYRRHYPLTEAARTDPQLNPGAGWVSPVSVEPRVAVTVIESLLMPFRANGQLIVLDETVPADVSTTGDTVDGVIVRSLRDDTLTDISATFYLDASELGDLLDLGGVEHVSGRQSREQTGEPGAADTADPTDMQAVTWCFAIEHRDGEDHTIDRPERYGTYRDWRPEALAGEPVLSFARKAHDGSPTRVYRFTPNPDDDPRAIDLDHRNMGTEPELWTYRRIIARKQFAPGYFDSDITIVNWPMNDYAGGPLFGVPDSDSHWSRAKELSESLLYWLQTEAPRPDGGTGWPGVRLRRDVAGTSDGFAMMPYIRESRRISARTTIVEQDVSVAYRGRDGARRYTDTVGTGHYFWIDRHATTGGSPGSGGRPQPFEIPLGALIPRRVRNLLPACRNIGTTHITNGCYRLHPVEWSIGEAVGSLASYCIEHSTEPHHVHENSSLLADFQSHLDARGVQRRWDPDLRW